MIESEAIDIRCGEPHVAAEQIMDVNIGTYGGDDYVLPVGKRVAAELVTNNSVRVFDGVMVYGGVRDAIPVNKYYDIPIDNGAQGKKRNDIIVRRLVREEGTNGKGSSSLVVVKGTPTEGTAVDPEIEVTDLRAGALTHDMPLHRVRIEGLNIVAVEPLFDILLNAAEMKKMLLSPEQNILWQNAGMFMIATQTATLTEKISEQKNGIVLVFSCYENSSTQNYGWQTHFIPRSVVSLLGNGAGHEISLARGSNVGSKYLYIYDDKISGNAANGTSPNSRWVMRYVIGV